MRSAKALSADSEQPLERASHVPRRGTLAVIAVVDYGLGNVRSVLNALARVDVEASLVSEPAELRRANRILLPGVGAFGDGMAGLRDRGLASATRDAVSAGAPLLGICLGMQLLATRSFEFGMHDGLDLIPGEVHHLDVAPALRVPHVGWNDLEVTDDADPLLRELGSERSCYFVHSYELRCDDLAAVTAVTDYGRPVTACVRSGKVYGCQFHPEKSAETGLSILRAFATC